MGSNLFRPLLKFLNSRQKSVKFANSAAGLMRLGNYCHSVSQESRPGIQSYYSALRSLDGRKFQATDLVSFWRRKLHFYNSVKICLFTAQKRMDRKQQPNRQIHCRISGGDSLRGPVYYLFTYHFIYLFAAGRLHSI